MVIETSLLHPKRLRIGNKFRLAKTGEIVQITAIDGQTFQVKLMEGDWIPLTDLEAIELTDEFLNSTPSFMLSNGKYQFYTRMRVMYIEGKHNRNCRYVSHRESGEPAEKTHILALACSFHQLQNIVYALTGEDVDL